MLIVPNPDQTNALLDGGERGRKAPEPPAIGVSTGPVLERSFASLPPSSKVEKGSPPPSSARRFPAGFGAPRATIGERCVARVIADSNKIDRIMPPSTT